MPRVVLWSVIVAFTVLTHLLFEIILARKTAGYFTKMCSSCRVTVCIHTGQYKRTGGCYNELVVAFFSTGGGVKG